MIQSELPRGPLISAAGLVGGLIAFEMAKLFTGNTEFLFSGSSWWIPSIRPEAESEPVRMLRQLNGARRPRKSRGRQR